MAGLISLSFFVPIFIHDHKGYNCRLCASKQHEETIYIYGIPIYRKMEIPQKTTYTELYDKYITETHEHQWAGGGLGRYVRYLFIGGVHKDGLHNTKYSLFQYRMSCDVLSLMELFENEDLEFRREIYHELIECEDPKDYEKAKQLIEAIRGNPENKRILYEEYLQRKTDQSRIDG